MLRQEELIGGLIKEWSLDSLSRSQRATGKLKAMWRMMFTTEQIKMRLSRRESIFYKATETFSVGSQSKTKTKLRLK